MCSEEYGSTNGLKMGLPLQVWVEKTVYGVEIHWLSDNENVSGTAVCKEGHADYLLVYDRTYDYWFH